MQNAVSDVLKADQQKSLAEIAAMYQVDRNALSRRISGQVAIDSSQGRKAFLSAEEDAKLAQFLIEMSDLGFGYTLDRMRYLVRTQLNKDIGEITHGWHSYFMKRHPELSVRRTEALDRLRARSMNKESLDQYFGTLTP